MKQKKLLSIAIVLFQFVQYAYIPYQTPYLTLIQTSTSFIGIIIGTYGRSQMVLRLSVGLLQDYKNKHKMIMLIPALSSGCVSLFRIIFNNGIVFLIENLFSVLARAMSFFQAGYALCLFIFSCYLCYCVNHFFYLL